MNSNSILIGDRNIGIDYPPLVIAEIGINHEGSLEIAKKMVDEAFEAGAEIIKHQTHIIEDEMSEEAKKVIPGNTNVSIYEVMKRCALSEEDEIELKNYIESKGMIFISTPFSRAAANRLERMGVVAYKIGSGECNNYPLIEHIARFGKPMIVSTGMNDTNSIRKTVDILESYRIQYALLHCTNVYPTPANLVRLGAMLELKREFPNAVIGLSDHTVNNNASLAAVALGACILERHFTDTMNRKGPDIICSMDPRALSELIQGSREIAVMRGGEKKAVKEEQVTIDFAFSTVVAIKEIEKGEPFTEENIWVKRPGTGEIHAEYYKSIIGKKAANKIVKETHLKFSDIVK
ncbi:N-acetylneuraminate synthase [Ureibacillus chungkukjangi]|uniref:N-acetylneuraminate synthase n=1 Tax=Ureibacillus chungkukjangi TaxID=1202712 RepID=UPI00203C09BF|nr:N-acetylneuraminate synthase [Ureibacillus chungkukjangi]MCM3389086.1 N-acetylneuraminate synthase [Ureibacillus chungkukjangi]